MAASKFEQMWLMMSKYPFKVDPDCSQENLSCSICQGLMVDACKSLCGCQYCYECIKTYILKGQKYCPGNKKECQEEHLDLEKEVTRNNRMNNKISRLTVKCPNGGCQQKAQLSQMEDHLKVCAATPLEGPSKNISEGERLELSQHIDNLSNELNQLNNQFRMRGEEISFLREGLGVKENEIAALKEDVGEIMRRFEEERNKTKEVMKKLEDVVNKDKEERNKYYEDRDKIEEPIKKNENVIKKNNEAKEETEKNNIKIEKRIAFLYNVCFNKCADFVWKIEDIAEKMRARKRDGYDSPPFYINKYRFCLNFRPFKGQIGLNCSIMKGDFDDESEWPMKMSVILTIHNQKDIGPFKCEIFQYDSNSTYKAAFNRTTEEKNRCYIGWPNFITYSSIEDNPEVVEDNAILVSMNLCNLVDKNR